jgi:hypothetical protein
MKIRIYDVGRDKKSSEIEVADDCDRDWVASSIYNEVRRMNALRSRDIECTWDPFHARGEIFAGAHSVGHAERIP